MKRWDWLRIVAAVLLLPVIFAGMIVFAVALLVAMLAQPIFPGLAERMLDWSEGVLSR